MENTQLNYKTEIESIIIRNNIYEENVDDKFVFVVNKVTCVVNEQNQIIQKIPLETKYISLKDIKNVLVDDNKKIEDIFNLLYNYFNNQGG